MTYFTKDEMRQTIIGKVNWSKCPQCDGTGYENWDEDGFNVKSGNTDDPNRASGGCENCEELGYIVRG